MQNWNLRHIYKICFFFIFLRRFLRVWLQSFQKVLIWQKKFRKKSKKISKNAEFHADFERVEKVVKKCTKKVISKTSLTNMSKSEKNTYFGHVFANNFFSCIFSKLLQRTGNQCEVLRFFIPILNFWMEKFFLLLLAHFVSFVYKCARSGSKKRKNFFMNVS